MNGLKKWVAGAVFTMFLGLIGTIYAITAGEIKDNKAAIVKSCDKTEAQLKEMDKKKVDNQTMQLMIQVQQQQIEQTSKNLDRVYDEIKELKNK